MGGNQSVDDTEEEYSADEWKAKLIDSLKKKEAVAGLRKVSNLEQYLLYI